MAKSQKLSPQQEVDAFFIQLNHPLKDALQLIRKLILEADPEVAEHIKWNSPSFYYSGEMKAFDPKEYKRDIVVSNLHKNDSILLIFPTGNVIDEGSGLLGGNFKDTRKSITFSSIDEVQNRSEDLQNIIRNWLSKVEKD
ncbi:MAG: DUF1801 domain-containing protein [Saprospiraceae bacterium]|nr:DUF1801 domain-containing protein [Saprospiraceae bacterium]